MATYDPATQQPLSYNNTGMFSPTQNTPVMDAAAMEMLLRLYGNAQPGGPLGGTQIPGEPEGTVYRSGFVGGASSGAADWWNALLAGQITPSGSNAAPPPTPTTTNTTPPTPLSGVSFGSSIPGAQQTGFNGPLQDPSSFFLPTPPTGASSLFSQIPTGLANNDVTHTPNNNITVGGSPNKLPVGSMLAPKPGNSIVYGVHQGEYGYYEIPTNDLSNSVQKYGIHYYGAPLTTRQMAEMNDPSGYQAGKYSAANNWGFNQTGGWVGTNPGSGGTGGTGGGGGVVNDPPGGSGGTGGTGTPPPPPSGPQLPELTGSRKTYLDAIDAYIKSQKPYATIDDALRRSFNLPGMAELQMNQQANPQANPAYFNGNTAGNPFIPGSAPPQGFKWQWVDPDGSGPTPGNYGLAPSSTFFNDLKGTNIEDLQQLVNTYNDPTFANKYLPNSTDLMALLGGFGSFVNMSPQGTTGVRASLAPMEAINMLAPMIENSQVSQYLGNLIGSVKGRLGSQYSNFNPFQFSSMSDPTQLTNYFRRVNDQLGLAGLPSIDNVLNSYKAGSSLERDQFYNGNSLDFYQPSERAPAFFQYLLGDFDGSGPAPETYGLRLRGNPRTEYDANQVLQILNDPRYKNMINPTTSNINPNIFTQTLNMEGNPLYTLLKTYKFPDGAGGPAGGTQNNNLGTGQQQSPQLSMERWVPGANEQTGAQEAATRQAENSKWQSLYGGGFGTGDLNTNSTTGTNTTTTSTPTPANTTSTPNPFAGVTTPFNNTNDGGRPPAFKTNWSLYT